MYNTYTHTHAVKETHWGRDATLLVIHDEVHVFLEADGARSPPAEAVATGGERPP
jgi:hypothetical protein